MIADGTGVCVGGDDRACAAGDRIQAGADPGVGDVDGDPVQVHGADQSPSEAAEPAVVRFAAAVACQAPVVVGRPDDANAEPGESPCQFRSRAKWLCTLKMQDNGRITSCLGSADLPDAGGHSHREGRVLMNSQPLADAGRRIAAVLQGGDGSETASTPPSRRAARSRRTDHGVTDGAAATTHSKPGRAMSSSTSGPFPAKHQDISRSGPVLLWQHRPHASRSREFCRARGPGRRQRL